MTHPMREFRDALREGKARLQADARAAFGPVDIWPADPVEKAADKLLRKARARPQPRRPVPWIIPFLFGAAAMALAVGLTAFAASAIAPTRPPAQVQPA